jgi:hypothetical protein
MSDEQNPSTPAAAPAAPAASTPAPSANPEQGRPAWWQSTWAFVTGLVVACAVLAYAMSVWEVVSRAKNAYQEGEKYYAWMNEPVKKKAYFDAELSAGRITQEDHERLMEDSDLKNAYVWYETAVDLFQPPRSKWVKLSEERLKELKPKREAWLRSLGVDYVDDSAHPDTRFHW